MRFTVKFCGFSHKFTMSFYLCKIIIGSIIKMTANNGKEEEAQ